MPTTPKAGISVSSPTVTRDALARRARAALERACPGSRTALRGSLASGTADEFSDIDVEWIVPDARFAECASTAGSVLSEAHPVAEVRTDPDLARSDRRRLLFVRFEAVPLFWRLDLDVRAESVAGDPGYDSGNPRARAADDEWSRPASALANATAAIKAVARGKPDTARGLLDRGFARIAEPAEATGAWTADISRLAESAAVREPRLRTLAEQIASLAAETLA